MESILSPLHTVELERGTITLNDSGAVQLKVVGLTQFDLAFGLTFALDQVFGCF